MSFYRVVIEDHITDVMNAFKLGKLTHEQALKKIDKAYRYLHANERYTNRQEKPTDSGDIQPDQSKP